MSECFVVPTDFSPDAEMALQYAITLGVALQARIVLLHIRDETQWNPWAYTAGTEAAIRELLHERLQTALDAGLTGAVDLVHGVPWREILTQAEGQNATLIVMGTHGRTGLRHLLLGSVAERVIRHALCPVLVTRHPGTPQVEQDSVQGCVMPDRRAHSA